MSRAATDNADAIFSGNPYLAGVYAPMREELTIENLPVTGTIPAALNGRYQIVLVVGAALLVYLALRVVQIKRPSLPYLIAYPAFVLIFVGGGLVAFIALSHVAAAFGYSSEDPLALASILGGTGLCLLFLSWIARRAVS